MTTPSGPDPQALLRSRAYVRLLAIAAILGIPLSAAAYGFLALINEVQDLVYHDLPHGLGFSVTPNWWPLPVLIIAGLIVGATIQYLPGRGGHVPADGFHAGGHPAGVELPGIVLAALASIALGAVIGPEAPLIALGSGLAVLAVRLVRRNIEDNAVAVVAAAGSFAAISALIGSPLVGAFLLMEASGLGASMGLVLLPGLLASGIGALIFVGLGHWTGLGTFSLAIPNMAPVSQPTIGQFGWAIVIGLGAALIGLPIHRASKALVPLASRRLLLMTPLAGLVVALLALAFVAITGADENLVLFSGQQTLATLVTNQSSQPAWILVTLLVCKGLGYLVSLAAFRGGPVFPSLFLGATLGITLAHLPGLPVTSGAAMGVAAMMTVMLGLPFTSVLLAAIIFPGGGLNLIPLVIVSAVVAYVTSARLLPRPGAPSPAPG